MLQPAARTTASPHPVSERSLTKPSHLVYIDNLRTTLITFVILLHMAITYGADGGWYYYEAGESNPIVFVVMMFVAAIGSACALLNRTRLYRRGPVLRS